MVEDLSVPGSVERFSARVPKGKIVCIAGQVGSGAVDVVNALAGLVHNASGKILVGGRPLTPGSSARALKRNIMFISGDRAEEGMFRRLRVLDNLIATRLGRLRHVRRAAAAGAARQRAARSHSRSASTDDGCARRPTS